MVFNKVAVLGVGLIGGSLARALRRHSLCGEVSGYGRKRENLEHALRTGAIDSFDLDPRRACEGADLVVLATPPGTFEGLVEVIRGALKEGAIVIDVGSVKGALVYILEGLMPQGVGFLGCHPIAGIERSGVEASDAELFNGAVCVITRTGRTDEGRLSRISSMWEKIGSRVVYMSPEEHDRVFGLVSHFPHLAAYALVNTVAEIDPESIKYAGQGFKDTTRIAMSPPDLWREICLMNRDNILGAIDALKKNLVHLAGLIEAEDARGLDEAFGRARALRRGVEG